MNQEMKLREYIQSGLKSTRATHRLATVLGRDVELVRMWTEGERSPDPGDIRALADALRLDPVLTTLLWLRDTMAEQPEALSHAIGVISADASGRVRSRRRRAEGGRDFDVGDPHDAARVSDLTTVPATVKKHSQAAEVGPAADRPHK